MWSLGVFTASDAFYWASNLAVPSTVWPTAAVGMNLNLPQLRAFESLGVHFRYILLNGYCQFIWYGT